MAVFETVLKETSSVVFRVRADTQQEAREKFISFLDNCPDIVDAELYNSTSRMQEFGPMEQVRHATNIRYPTVIGDDEVLLSASVKEEDL